MNEARQNVNVQAQQIEQPKPLQPPPVGSSLCSFGICLVCFLPLRNVKMYKQEVNSNIDCLPPARKLPGGGGVPKGGTAGFHLLI